MVDGKCSKGFPKEFVQKTYAGNDLYPHYRRKNNGRYVVKGDHQLDNRYVVPYNTYLTMKYNVHINVELCSSIISCMYFYKYVYKGSDMTSVAVESANSSTSKEGHVDEIKKFVIQYL